MDFSAVLDVNRTKASSDNVAEHLLERMKPQMTEKEQQVNSKENTEQDTVYIIPRGRKPGNECYNSNLLLGIFPSLFSCRYDALEDCWRPVQTNCRAHLKYLLSQVHRRFEEHHSFIFVIFNILQHRMRVWGEGKGSSSALTFSATEQQRYPFDGARRLPSS